MLLNYSCLHILISLSRFSPFVPSSGVFKNVSLIVDGTDCAVDRPSHRADRNYLSNGRHKENTYGRYNLKYTVACQVCTGKICYVFGPEGGSVADITSLRNGELVSIITSYDPLEIVLADKGYQGLNSCLSPHKGRDLNPEQEAFNEVLASVRILVECVIKRIKQFGVLGNRGRFHCDISKHKLAFNVCCQISNITFEFEPVWNQINWHLRK